MSASKYYAWLGMVFVAVLLTANVIGEKPVTLGIAILPAGIFLFPLTYLLGDVLTEVYGFLPARRVIWMGMLSNIFMALMCYVAIRLPTVEEWDRASAYAEILGRSSRLMVVSVLSYFIGELVNAYIVAFLKVKMQGRSFWLRALCGSWIGEAVETSIFIPLAFYQTLSVEALWRLAASYYSFKILYSLCAMPLVNILVQWLKTKESAVSRV